VLSFKPKSTIEASILDLWKELDPSAAFIGGLKEYAGRMPLPDFPHLESMTRKIDELSSKSETRSQKRLLASLGANVKLALMGEAQIPPDIAISAFFAHLIKEGMVATHLTSLANETARALRAYASTGPSRPCPTGIKILTSIRCAGLLEVGDMLKKQTRSKQLQSAVQSMVATVNDYSQKFGVTGFKNSGFDEIVEICSREGCDLGRSSYYADALANLYDYSESPTELEARGMSMLDRELPSFKREVEERASKLGVEAKAEVVAHTISKKKALKASRVVGYIKGLKQHVAKLVSTNIVKINPRYVTRVVETPTYLSGMFPSGGAMFLDFLTKKPFQVFMATTDPRRAPETSPAELLNLLVHEEYGHCLHSSNSAMSFGAKPTLTEMLQSQAGNAVSEGISFHREVEFLNYLNEMKQRKATTSERAFLKFLAKYGGADEIFEEYTFFTHLWRMVRFLRVVGDARINSDEQNLMEFIDWANRETGLSKSMVYHQVFPAHQGNGPGYASTYAILGESVATIQQEALRNGKKLVDFDTYACSLGFPPRSVFEEKLRAYATG
jgi:hypothetical protein